MTPLDPALTRSAAPVFDLPLSAVLLRDDTRWPWLILVPRRPGLTALHDLAPEDAHALMREIRAASRALAAEPGVARVNVGALGNVVAQLHVHVVGRWPGDPAWPGPVWGVEGRIPYAGDARAALAARLHARINSDAE
ncbi:MAG: HIT family protein [Alphaproteobacteria bacterium]|nr:HIT family protein [Alphaproteobacteria bacterium]